MSSIPDDFLMPGKQSGQIGQRAASDQRSLCHPNRGTDRRIEHPRGHAACRPVSQTHINHVPFPTGRAGRLVIFPEQRVKLIENLRG